MTRLASVLGVALLTTATAAAEPSIHSDLDPDPSKGFYAADPSQCLGIEGRPDIRIKATDLRSGEGNVRFVLYGDKPEEFLEKGKRLVKFEVPADENGVEVCISAPKAGTYALAILHDENNNHKFNMTTDGGGFSNNPTLFLGAPSFEDSKFDVGDNGGTLEIELKYMLPERDTSHRLRRR